MYRAYLGGSAMERQEFLEVVEHSWQQLDDALAGIDDEAMQEPGVIDTWSLQGLLGHVSTWEQVALRHVEQWRSGQPVSGLGGVSIDDYNAQESARRQSWSLAQIRAEASETRERLRTTVQSLTDEEWHTIVGEGERRRPLGDWIGGALGGDLGPGTHASEHAEQIRAWRAGRDPR
jgi:hypothetical protein